MNFTDARATCIIDKGSRLEAYPFVFHSNSNYEGSDSRTTDPISREGPKNPIQILNTERLIHHLLKTLARLSNVTNVSIVTLGVSPYPSRQMHSSQLKRMVQAIWTQLGPQIQHLRIWNSWCVSFHAIVLPEDLALPCLTSISIHYKPGEVAWPDFLLQFIRRHRDQIQSLEVLSHERDSFFIPNREVFGSMSSLNEVSLMLDYPSYLLRRRMGPIVQFLQAHAQTLKRVRLQVRFDRNLYELHTANAMDSNLTTSFLAQNGSVFSNLTSLVIEPSPLSSLIPILRASSETLRELQICYADLDVTDLQEMLGVLKGSTGIRLTRLEINPSSDTLALLAVLNKIEIPEVWLNFPPIRWSDEHEHPIYVTETVERTGSGRWLVCVFDSTLKSNVTTFEQFRLDACDHAPHMTVTVVHKPTSVLKTSLHNPCGPGGCEVARLEAEIFDTM